jgi:SAM-dependent methyltransferase
MSELYIFSPEWRLRGIPGKRFQLFSFIHRRAFELNHPYLDKLVRSLAQPFSLADLQAALMEQLANPTSIYELLLQHHVVTPLTREHIYFTAPAMVNFHPTLPLDSLLPGDEWVATQSDTISPLSIIRYCPQGECQLEWQGQRFSVAETGDFFTFPQVVVTGARVVERLERRSLAEARYLWVLEQLTEVKGTVLNFGCGYGALEHFFLSRQRALAHWVSLDRDPESIKRAAFPKTHQSMVWDFGYPDALPVAETLILMEVIEHWPLEKVKSQLLQLVELIQPQKILLTLPNSDLNGLYGLSKGFRHADHHWELGTSGMNNLLNEIFESIEGVSMKQSGVGRNYEGRFSTNTWVIKIP